MLAFLIQMASPEMSTPHLRYTQLFTNRMYTFVIRTGHEFVDIHPHLPPPRQDNPPAAALV